MDRLLVTGVDGPLGSNLALALADRWDVLGLYSHTAVEAVGLQTGRAACGDRGAMHEWLEKWRPQWILHCPALTAGNWDRVSGDLLADGSPEFVASLARLASDVQARLTVLSSDAIFAGPRMFHEETSTAFSPAPRAAQIRAMESALEHSAALVVRTHAYGWSPVPGGGGFAQVVFESLSRGISVAVHGRRHATPILATDLAELLVRAHELRLHGLYHLAGAERTSPWAFAAELAAALGVRWTGNWSASADLPSSTWHDETSLDSKRARRALEIATPMLREGLYRFAAQAHNGWRDRWQAVDHHGAERELAA